MIPPRILGCKARSKDVMLEKTFRVWLDSSPPEKNLFPWRQGAAEVERECGECPDYGGKVDVNHPGPAEDQEAPPGLRIVRQLVIESLLVSVAGGALGWWLAEWGVRAYQVMDRSWRILDFTMNFRALAYLISISIATGLAFGLVPAIRLSKLTRPTGIR